MRPGKPGSVRILHALDGPPMLGEIGTLGMIDPIHHKSGWRPVKVISVTAATACHGGDGCPRTAAPVARGSRLPQGRGRSGNPGSGQQKSEAKERRPDAGETTGRPRALGASAPEEHAGVVLRPSCLRPDFPPGLGLPVAVEHACSRSTPLRPIPPAARPCATSLPPAELPSAGQPPCSACPCGGHSATRHECEPVRKDPELL